MGFRFRNRIKIAPGLYLNLGKRGINSLTGRVGAFTTNYNRSGFKHTVGLHGTGLSYETKRSKVSAWFWIVVVIFLLLVIF